MSDIIALLNEFALAAASGGRPEIQYVPATREVIGGADLEATGNQAHGSSVYVSTSAPPNIDRETLLTGETWRVGECESYHGCELRCDREGDQITFALVGDSGQAISRTLFCDAGTSESYDEGLFTWLGPAEYIGTAWSDNDPMQCQVITIDVLREFAEEYGARAFLEEIARQWSQKLEAVLPTERHGDFDASCAGLFEESAQEWYLALVAAGASINRRRVTTPAEYCSYLLSSKAEAYIEMMLTIEDDDPSAQEEAEDVARAYLKRNYEDKTLAQPMAKIFLQLQESGWTSLDE